MQAVRLILVSNCVGGRIYSSFSGRVISGDCTARCTRDTRHILAMAKAEDGIRMLLDIDHVLQEDDRLARWVSPADEAHAA